MKKTLAIIAVASMLAAGTASAGSLAKPLAEPVVTPEVIVTDTVNNASKTEMLVATVAIMTIILGAAGAF